MKPFKLQFYVVSSHSIPFGWEPMCYIGGGGGPQLLVRPSCCDLPKWEPTYYAGGGGGPQAHPSDSFGVFNERENLVFSRCYISISVFYLTYHTLLSNSLQRLMDELKEFPALQIVGPRTFKWWGNSCHYHTFLQV